MARFDDILSAARDGEESIAPPAPTQRIAKPKAEKPQQTKPAAKANPWSNLEPDEKEPTIRLNVDIAISLNDKLAAKALRYRKKKSELVRMLLEWALEDEDN